MATDRELAEMIAQLPEREQVAFRVLKFGKDLVPDRFPKASSDTRRAWGLVLGEMRVPLQVWPEAIAWWSMNSVGDRMATPKELKEAARHIVQDVWETDPEKSKILARYRRDRLQAREARGELPPGTSPETWGDEQHLAIEQRREDTALQWKQLKAGVAARKKARREAERQSDTPTEWSEEGA